MQERDNKSDQPKRELCNIVSGKSRCGDCPLDRGQDPVSNFRRCNRLDKGEVQYDWAMTLAAMFDDPTQDFDLNLEKQI